MIFKIVGFILILILIFWYLKPCNNHKFSICVYIYNIGNYDKQNSDNLQLPSDIDGFFYIGENDVLDPTFERTLKMYGWKILKTKIENGTQFVDGNRLTIKKLKFIHPHEIKNYDFVVTHDFNRRLDYTKIRKFITNELIFKNKNVFLKSWNKKSEYGNCEKCIWDEMNSMLNERKHFITTSKPEVLKWKTFLKNELNTGKFTDKFYFELNLIIFKPSDINFQKVCDYTYEKCKLIQRDQFIFPYALQKFNYTNYIQFTETFLKHAIEFKQQSRHQTRN